VINKIDVLSGKKLCTSCKKLNGHTPSCSQYKKPNPQLSQRECRLVAGLSAGHDLVKTIEQGGNFQAAANEYKRWAPAQKHLEEWTDRQVIPYKPVSGDIIEVKGEEFSVVEVRGISNEHGVELLTLVVKPLHRSETKSESLSRTSDRQPIAISKRKPLSTAKACVKRSGTGKASVENPAA
jgi:hypothetical protein